MSETIKDGRGSNNLAGVNTDNQLIVRAITNDGRVKAGSIGQYYEPWSGDITLTDALEKGILYIYNTGDLDIVIDRVFFDLWESTGGSGGATLKYYKNPTVTGGTSVTAENSNFSQPNALTATVLKNLTTMTGQVYAQDYVSVPSANIYEEGQIFIPTGYKFGVSLQAPTGNTSMVVTMNISCYLLNTNLI